MFLVPQRYTDGSKEMDGYKTQYENRTTISTYWHNKSADLMVSARVLWEAMEANKQAGLRCNSTYKMLFGMSLELLLKAHCVGQKIENPRIEKTHNLNEIAGIAGLKLEKSDNKILEVLSEYIIWDGRYPAPKEPSKLKRHWENIQDTAFDREPLGTLEVLKPNNTFCFDNLHRIWRRLSDEYMRKYNET